MNIIYKHLLSGAQQAEGLAVIIDVFRAFSLEAYLFAGGLKALYPTESLQKARAFKVMNPDFLLFGEREGIIQPGFDYGNSPFHASKLNLQDKSAVHASSSGTPGLIAALDSADQVITASFVNAAAVARYIKTQNPKTVTLVDMGWAGRKETLEDKICACYIFSLLSGEEFRFPDYIYQIYQTDGKRFFLPENQPSMPPEDFFFCLRLNIFDFILKADLDKFDRIIIQKIN